ETEKVKYNDVFEFYARWHSKQKKVKFERFEKEFLEKLKVLLKIQFDVDINLTKIVSRRLILHRLYFDYYITLLKKIQPSIVVTTVWYSCISLIKAAKEMNIPIVELQHGVITKYNVNYNFLS